MGKLLNLNQTVDYNFRCEVVRLFRKQNVSPWKRVLLSVEGLFWGDRKELTPLGVHGSCILYRNFIFHYLYRITLIN